MLPFRRPEQYAALHRRKRTAGLPLVVRALTFAAIATVSAFLQAQSPSLGALRLRQQGAPARTRPILPPGGLQCEDLETGTLQRSVLAGAEVMLQQLAPGPYRVSVLQGAGQSPPPPVEVEVHAGETVTLVFDRVRNSLQAEVTSSPAGVDGESAGAGPGTSKADISAPGIASDQDADGLPSAHGLPDLLNTAQLDGVSVTQRFHAVPAGSGADPDPDPDADPDSAERTAGPAHGLAQGRHAGIAYLFSASATREFRLQSAGYSAQTANAGGAEVNRVSRSGTRSFHGEAFFVLRSSAFAATDPDSFATSFANGVVSGATVKPHDLRERFGGSLSGPVAGHPFAGRRVFFLAVYEAQRRGFPAVSSPADPDFYNLSASQRALLANRGLSPTQIDAGLSFLSSLTGPVARRADQDLVFGRLDWLQHPRLQLGAQANLVRWNDPAGLVDAPVVARGRASLGNASGDLAALLLRVDSRFSARTSNSLRVEFLRDTQYETAQPRLAQEPATGPAGVAPGVTIGPNGLQFGTPASLVAGALPDERRLQLTEALSLVRGRHAFTLGGSVSHIHDRSDTTENAAGTFHYDTTAAPGGLADFLTDFTYNAFTLPNGGCPSIHSTVHLFCFQSYTQSFGETSTDFSTTDFAAFAEDTWRPLSRLSMHAGIRYEYTLLPLPVAPNPALDVIFNPSAVVAGTGIRAATSIFPEDRNNFGPRVSAALEPFGAGRGTVRAGYGIFFGRLPGATLSAALTQTGLPAGVSRLRLTPAYQLTCISGATTGSQGFGYPCSLAAEPSGAAAQTASAVVFDRSFRLPVVQQGSLTLERSFAVSGIHATVSAGYLLNLDRQLPGSTDLNLAPSSGTATFRLQGGSGSPGVRDGESFTLPVYTARVSPSFGPVTALVSHSNGVYHGLLLVADTQAGKTLALHADYTWSKAIDDAPDLSATPRTDSQLDPYANGYDKGLSLLNYPWIVHARLRWQPRLASRSRTLRRLGSGWRVETLVNARAGRPYSLNTSGGTSLAGGHLSLNGSGGALYLPTVGRNTLRLPVTSTADLRLARILPAGRLHAEASAEAFNLFNRRNISAVNARAYLRGTPVNGVTPLVFQDAAGVAAEGLNTTPFGTPLASATEQARARQVQLELRLLF